MHSEVGRPMRGEALMRMRAFLSSCDLQYDEHINFTVVLIEDGHIVASGSLDGFVLKCIAIAPEHRGEDLTARVLTELRKEAFERGLDRLMLYTKPSNLLLFQNLGFYSLVRTGDCLLMEDRKEGLDGFLSSVKDTTASGEIGCIVAHCNPFTLGHLYLIERAAKECSLVYVFILSEQGGLFTPSTRLQLAMSGCSHLTNVRVHESGPYMVSSATFPTYFLRDKSRADEVFCALDISLFRERIAPMLKITRRYVGTEPLCPVTEQYNRALHLGLEPCGIKVCESERLEHEGEAISASRVRALLGEKRFDEIRPLVPKSTFDFLINHHL